LETMRVPAFPAARKPAWVYFTLFMRAGARITSHFLVSRETRMRKGAVATKTPAPKATPVTCPPRKLPEASGSTAQALHSPRACANPGAARRANPARRENPAFFKLHRGSMRRG
jgi:hypothetical protein